MDSINPAFNQKYTFITYRVADLLRKWKVLQPCCETKLAENVSPLVQSVMAQCLTLFCKQIAAATKSLKDALDYIEVIRTAYRLHSETEELFDNGASFYNRGIEVEDDAELLLVKFKNSNISFKKLPYEFQSRLVALLPIHDMKSFSLAGKTAAKAVKTRGERRGETFSIDLIVTEPSPSLTQQFKNHKVYDVLYTNDFLKLGNYFIEFGLWLSGPKETFDHAVKNVSGDYIYVDLRRTYTWQHAIHLMNVSKSTKLIFLRRFVQLEVEDFDKFFDAVVQWFSTKKSALMFHMVYQHLDESFPSRFEAVIEARTELSIVFVNGHVTVHKPLKYWCVE